MQTRRKEERVSQSESVIYNLGICDELRHNQGSTGYPCSEEKMGDFLTDGQMPG